MAIGKPGLTVICVLLAGCSWSMGERRAVDGHAGEPEFTVVVAPSTLDGELKAVVRGIVTVPPGGAVELREVGVESYVPWNPVKKLAALPLGVGAVALTPLALVVGIVGTPFGAEFGDKHLPVIMLPWLTLAGGACCLADFAWFFQPLPDLSFDLPHWDELPLRRTGSEGVVRREGLRSGRCSVPAQALPVGLCLADGTETGFGVTDDEGEVRFRVSPARIAAGGPVKVTLRFPTGDRALETTIEAVGAELTAFPPPLQSGK